MPNRPHPPASRMKRFVALLRGINVGKAKRIPMAELRALLSDLGYEGVATLLNSGNVVFRSTGGSPAKHAGRIANAIATTLRLDVPVIVKSASELDAIVSDNPLAAAAADHSRLIVAFVQESRSLAALQAIEALVAPPDRWVIGPHAAYLHCPAGILASKAGEALLGKAGKSATTRNWATVLKLQTQVNR